jgi:D-3-phosphoglycerate dehydrogenase / 2-oxoglutarate reductase
MFKIQTLNKISSVGLDLLPHDNYEIASEISNPDAIILRSFKMHEMELSENTKAIARAGAGVNNIPIDKCSENGIVVFNTPGANANAVKELVLSGMLLSSRQLASAMEWVKTLSDKGDQVPQLVEKGKSNFQGSEIKGKKLGVIGLGAIGVMVANDAIALGMKVCGFDPFISVESAWGLNTNVEKCISIDHLLSECDFISIHVPLSDSTRGLFNADKFKLMKDGVVLLNFARGGLVNNADLNEALKSNKIYRYVTDFPDEDLINMQKVICLPHLGASTEEAENNCAKMAASELRDYLEKGTIKNSVNFPSCELPASSDHRLIIANKNIPNMVGQITTVLAAEKINIADMINKHKDNIAYNIIDIDSVLSEQTINKIKEIEGVIMIRTIKN